MKRLVLASALMVVAILLGLRGAADKSRMVSAAPLGKDVIGLVRGGQFCYVNPPVQQTTCPANQLSNACSDTKCTGGPNMRVCPDGTMAAGGHISTSYYTYCSVEANGAQNCGYRGFYCNYTRICGGCNVDKTDPNIYWCGDGDEQEGQGDYQYAATPSGANCFGGQARLETRTNRAIAAALIENGVGFSVFNR